MPKIRAKNSHGRLKYIAKITGVFKPINNQSTLGKVSFIESINEKSLFINKTMKQSINQATN
jgi:hypothetical protein